jgi:hypothetical protein
MYKARTLLALGTWIAILPFLGLPYAWKDNLTTLTGLVLMCLSYLLYKDYRKENNKGKTFDNFRENNNFEETNIEENSPKE